jgi:hypothetical protein
LFLGLLDLSDNKKFNKSLFIIHLNILYFN